MRVELMLRLQDAGGKPLLGVAFEHRNGGLGDDRSRVELGADDVHRAARHLHPRGECAGVHVESLERRQQRGVDVQHGSGRALEEPRSQAPHEASQADDIDAAAHQRVREGVERTLGAKGFQKADSNPDFWVAYHLSVEKKIDVYTTNRLYGGYGWTVSIPETRVNEYDEGSLIVDVSDAHEKKLVWRGIGTGRLRETPREDPEEQKQVVYQVVDEVLADFPPGK